MAFNPAALPPLLALLGNALIGAYVLGRDPAKAINRTFALLMAAFVIWDAGAALLRSAEDAGSALFWAKFIYLGVLFIAPLYAQFAHIMIGKGFNAALYYVPFALFLPALLTDAFVRGCVPQFGFRTDYGPLFSVFGILYNAVIIYALWLLWQARNAVKKPVVGRKLELMLYPMAVAIALGGLTNVALPMLGIYVFQIADFLTLFIAIGIAYAFTLKEK